jgi:hypothetical protein
MRTMSSEPVWKTKSPKKKSKKLTSAQRSKAKRAARQAGRPYPNAVDNINAAKG